VLSLSDNLAPTPKTLIGASALLLCAAGIFGVLNLTKVKALRSSVVDANAARESAERSRVQHEKELMAMLKEKGIAISDDMDGPLRPGSVVFVETPEGVTHRDYVTRAWTENPVKEVLVKMAATPALTRVAASAASPASR